MIFHGSRYRKAIASGLLVASAFVLQARADSRTTSFATYLHIGPGRQFAVTDEVPTRTTVEVAGCKNDWCQIRYGGAFGWVEQRMLVDTAQAGQAVPAPTPGECFDFVRTGWPNQGDLDRLCLHQPEAGAPTTR